MEPHQEFSHLSIISKVMKSIYLLIQNNFASLHENNVTMFLQELRLEMNSRTGRVRIDFSMLQFQLIF